MYKGERGDEFFSPLSGRVCVCEKDSANSDLHFPCTACEMFSDVGSVTAIIHKARSLTLSHPPPFLHLHAHRQFERMRMRECGGNYQPYERNGNSHLV